MSLRDHGKGAIIVLHPIRMSAVTSVLILKEWHRLIVRGNYCSS